jgi:hypothetical protein
MEQKLHDIVALLSSGRGAPDMSTMPNVQHTHLSSRHGMTEFMSSIKTPDGLSKMGSKGNESRWPSLDPTAINDVIGRGIISFEQAQNCVTKYKTQASSFPFVVVQKHLSLDVLRREKPFLLLGILAMATQTDPKLQDRLEAELREILSCRVIFNGEKSLDLLQGLLVYMNWY